jgi:hypothetical protein
MMATTTDDLIDSLASGLPPVRRLRQPLVRAALWVALATVIIAILTVARGMRSDFDLMTGDPCYVVQVIGAWLTGATATLAAFEISLPDRSRRWLLLPVPSLALWLYGFTWGCLAHWIAIPSGAPIMHDSMRCMETIIMASVPMALVLWLMLRRARPLRPAGTALVAAVAVAAFADTAHLLIHVVEASALVLLVNLIPVALIIAAGGFFGRRGLRPV